MNEDAKETQVPIREEPQSWLTQPDDKDDNSVDEVIRYTLDELRFA